LQLKIEQRLSQRHPKQIWLRIYQRLLIRSQIDPLTGTSAALIGVLVGWCMLYLSCGVADPTQWNLQNNVGNVLWLLPANLPPIRSVLFVGSLIQLLLVQWVVMSIPAWSSIHEPWTDDEQSPQPNFYCRLPLSPQDCLAMYMHQLPGKFAIITGMVSTVSFYVLLCLAYHGQLGVLPVGLGLLAGAVQLWLSYHMVTGLWVVDDYLKQPLSIVGHGYRSAYLILSCIWIGLPLLLMMVQAGWMARLWQFPELILDPEDPRATFGSFSGIVYYLVTTLYPTGWLNALLEAALSRRLGWNGLLLLPICGVAMVHWRRGSMIWPVSQLLDRPTLQALNTEALNTEALNPATLNAATRDQPERQGSKPELKPDQPSVAAWVETTPTLPRSYVQSAIKQILKPQPYLRTLPNGGCGPFAIAEAEFAKRIYFPKPLETREKDSWYPGGHNPLFHAAWYFFPCLLLSLLILARLKGPVNDVLIVSLVIGVHAAIALAPQCFVWDFSGSIRRGLLHLPIHADWLIALWVRSSLQWCLKWLGILAVTWIPIMQWFDRLAFVSIVLQISAVILLMNLGVAGFAFARTLDMWTELIKSQRNGFLDWRPISLRREFFLTVGTLFWVGTHLALLIEIGLLAPLWVIGIQGVISVTTSWCLLYFLKQTALYPTG